MPFLAAPIALLGLAALVPLAAIYLLHRRSRPRDVSSLLLWQSIARPTVGGKRVERLRTPIAFWLEVAALALLALAAAGPTALAGRAGPPLVAILDDSMSMAATDAGGQSPRDRAARALAAIARDEPSLTLILAGPEPRLLGAAREQTLDRALQPWSAAAHAADLLAAIALARDVAGPDARLIVLTDTTPDRHDLDAEALPNLRWRALGDPLDNLAIASLVRSERDAIVEIRSHARQPTTTSLTIETIPPDNAEPRTLAQQSLRLDPGRRERLRIDLPNTTDPIRARIDDDALAIDNAIVAVLDDRPPVRVRLSLADDTLADAARNAALATGLATIVGADPHLSITDAPTQPDPERWTLRIDPGAGDTRSFTPPFVVDRAHPLGDGLDLTGVIWAAPDPPASAAPTAERPIVLAGSLPLLTESAPAGATTIRLALDHARSTLLRSPAWPTLVWNLLAWRQSTLPGLSQHNVPVGRLLDLRLPPGEPAADLTAPDGSRRTVTPIDGVATLQPTQVGLWRAHTSTASHAFAAQPTAHDESDLRHAATADLGSLDADAATGPRALRSLAWAAGLLALAALAAHAFVLAPRPTPTSARTPGARR